MTLPIYAKICAKYVCCKPTERTFMETQMGFAHKAIKLDVSRAFRVYAEKKTDEIGPADWPCCIPPWPTAWLEWDMGGVFRAQGKERFVNATPAGAICCSFNRQRDSEAFDQQLKKFQYRLYDDSMHSIDDIEFSVLIRPWGFDANVGNAACYMPFLLGAFISGTGECIGMNCAYEPNEVSPIVVTTGTMFMFAHVPMFAFSLANCKNVIAEECEASYKLYGYAGRKKKQKRFYRYHVLKISGSFSGQAGQAAGEKLDKAMHICRGHFARYTDEAPLFGKYTGLFWKPMHVRGKVTHGIVDKDYELVGRSNTDGKP